MVDVFFRLATATAHRHSPPQTDATVGASVLARHARTTRSSRMHALSLTIFASKLAPTGFMPINP
ncbi:hypothetical protein PspCFBP13528_12360 [Pseudomonas sp. CFBP13528]|nr:hypothetical protein PspCFBP13528_12360 [Pseudomonas sp. CFBP13528]